MKPLNLLLLLATTAGLLLGQTGCTLTDGSPPPTPVDTAVGTLPTIRLLTDSVGNVALPLAQLGIDRTKPFRLTGGGFTYGTLVIEGDSVVFKAKPFSEAWVIDSGTISLYQEPNMRTGWMVVRNRIAIDTGHPQPAGCILSTEHPYYLVGEGGSATITVEAGAKIVEASAYFFTATAQADSLSVRYSALGGLAGRTGLNPGYDTVHLRIRTAAGACVRIQAYIGIGDTCQGHVDTYALTHAGGPGSSIFDTHANVLAHMHDCFGQHPLSATLRILPQTYSPPLQIKTRYGTLSDTTVGTLRMIVYRSYLSLGPGRGDSIPLYVEDASDGRLTTGILAVAIP